jgi:hypothetical protein
MSAVPSPKEHRCVIMCDDPSYHKLCLIYVYSAQQSKGDRVRTQLLLSRPQIPTENRMQTLVE